MLTQLLIAGLLLQQTTGSTATKLTTTQTAGPSAKQLPADDPAALLKIKRIYVDSFGDDAASKELQSMIVTSLTESKKFKVTESRDRADAILKGTALEKSSQELHAYGEATSVGTAAGASQGQINGSVANGAGSIYGSSSGGFAARHMATNDSSVNTETINDAKLSVRLVNPDGDVIWTSTQESKGAKYKGASADVADKCVKQLLRDIAKIDGGASSLPAVGAAEPQHK